MQNLKYVGKNLFLERVSIQNFLKKIKLLSIFTQKIKLFLTILILLKRLKRLIL